MRFLADENFPGDAVSALRQAGHEVAWICANAPGTPDRDVLRLAMREARILLTFDKDFGELALHEGLPASCGIVLFRLPMPSPSAAGRFITSILESRSDWAGNFSVIEPGRLRMRSLPPVAR
jgi:predicted nuclease of predicted toxin-antitoxin system